VTSSTTVSASASHTLYAKWTSSAPTILVAGANGAIRRSVDGVSWSASTLPNTAGHVVSMDSGSGAVVVMTSLGHLWRSLDRGLSWTQGTPAFALEPPSLAAFNVRHLGGRWFASSHGRIYTSDDGLSFTLRYDNTSLRDGYGNRLPVRSFARIGNSVMASGSSEGFGWTIRSTDGGLTWGQEVQSNATTMPGFGGNCSNILVTASSIRYFALGWSYCDGIVYSAADILVNASALPTSNWTNISPPSLFSQAMALGTDPLGRTLFIGGSGGYVCDAYVLLDETGSLVKRGSLGAATSSFGSSGCRASIVSNQGVWYLKAGDRIALSSDDGTTWTLLTPGIEPVTFAVMP
jgi:hypothetical protein